MWIHTHSCTLTCSPSWHFKWGRESHHFSLTFIRPVNLLNPELARRETESTLRDGPSALPPPIKLPFFRTNGNSFHFVFHQSAFHQSCQGSRQNVTSPRWKEVHGKAAKRINFTARCGYRCGPTTGCVTFGENKCTYGFVHFQLNNGLSFLLCEVYLAG